MEKMHEGFPKTDASRCGTQGDTQAWNAVAFIPTAQQTIAENSLAMHQHIVQVGPRVVTTTNRLISSEWMGVKMPVRATGYQFIEEFL